MKSRYIEHSDGTLLTSDTHALVDSIQTSLEDGLIRIRRHKELRHSMRHASVYTGSTGKFPFSKFMVLYANDT